MASKSPDHSPARIQAQHWLLVRNFTGWPVSPTTSTLPSYSGDVTGINTDGLTPCLSVIQLARSQDQPKRLVALWPEHEASGVPRPTTWQALTPQSSAILDDSHVCSEHRIPEVPRATERLTQG